ncbi:serine/threonine protein phosphatase [Sphingomonas yunnanensis]|uniref:metallophosphoesterase family protein n=1 Tax=Sphingomonas yunnanensis TaxID=310400 RepID=UPI001CA6B7FB|nr:metallophosphoesterase family protein [Sphingomonas yunnanensis]MBY9064137.1 serine/threonine protein phosphatase [Sphingomonas yunnanensis]
MPEERATPLLTHRLTYAVGDIHGRADLLARLLTRIRADRDARAPAGPASIVFLGDYVDRGPHSREVIDQLLAFAQDPGFESRFLLGNHEDAMLDYLDGRISGLGWSKHGGDATLRSYGVAPPREESRSAWAACRDPFRAAVPPTHRVFLERLELAVAQDSLLFVHAGIRPGVPLDRQEKRDLLWIRSEFLQGERDDHWLVVHGHTPKEEAYGGPGRLCLDSGSYLSGRLTAAVFDGGDVALIETHASGSRPFPVQLAG